MSLILIACAGAGRLLSNARRRRTEALGEMLTAMRVLRLRMMNSMETLGILLRKYTYRDARTLELQVNYAAPLTLADGRVKVRCQITALSRKIAHFYAAAYGAGDEPAATATGIFYLLSRPAQA